MHDIFFFFSIPQLMLIRLVETISAAETPPPHLVQFH